MSRPYRSFVFEPLDGRALFSVNPAAPLAATVLPAAVAHRQVYLVGNSMTDGVNYAGLAALLRQGASSVSLGRQTGPGYSIAMNYALQKGLFTSGIDPSRPSSTDPFGNYQNAFARFNWDTLTIQPGDRRLREDLHSEPTPHDEAELPNAMAFLRVMAANNSSGQVFVYSRPSRRTDVNEDLSPTGQPFDYSTEWLKTYDESAEQPAFINRSLVRQFMPMLRDAQANDPATRPLPGVKLIPAGEAYYNIDQMLKAGKFNGTSLHRIEDLYLDKSHPTPDLAAYVLGLTFFSALTGIDPRGTSVPAQYGTKVQDPKLAGLLQQAVYDAMTYGGYAGYTTILDGTQPPPPPPTNSAKISGVTFNDADRSGSYNGGDSLAGGKTVFLDTDNDGVLDPGEKSTVSSSAGSFAFTNLAAGTYHVRRVFPSGYGSSTPLIDLTLTSGQVVTGQAIGSVSNPTPPPPPPPSGGTAIFRGYVINDLSGDGKWNNGEKGIAGRTVWLDLDNDGKLDANEPKQTTGTNGLFEFKNLAAGAIYVREVLPSGWKQTSPTSNKPLTATLTAGQTKSGQYFAVKQG